MKTNRDFLFTSRMLAEMDLKDEYKGCNFVNFVNEDNNLISKIDDALSDLGLEFEVFDLDPENPGKYHKLARIVEKA